MSNQKDYQIELYRGDQGKLFGTIPFMPILRESMEGILGRSLLLESLFIIILQVPEESFSMEPPLVENLVPSFGYTYVKVYQGNFVIYQHPHPLYDVVTQTLRAKLIEQYPEETRWGFRLDVPGIPPVTSPPSRATIATTDLRPPGKITVSPYPPGGKPNFNIRRLAEAEPPIKTLADFGVTADSQVYIENSFNLTEANGDRGQETENHITSGNTRNTTELPDALNQLPVKIVLSKFLHQDLCKQRPFSHKVEEGGFLIGRVYRDGDNQNTYLLEVTDALTATHTGASFLHLTFKGDSFVDVKRTLRQNHLGKRLLGWYHTHLFPATSGFGLSSIDVALHFSTFTISWQLAGLINLDRNKRTLRFYVRQGNQMVICPYWLTNERN
ncbi:JAB N-terminal domain-containing protein [Moorena sp. SIO4G3]|uniref:JAB N-terminal domain-containing protein n=1 Tax=Moorena sp. SIO4G3 TaxID=2607821 RepID=UPI00142A8840|nr:JAB N-terminal domain-containing protein [Moorena sp. SIO4G3]NEO80542.1 hypothetical protein [Moorena sp. SIO4G3]